MHPKLKNPLKAVRTPVLACLAVSAVAASVSIRGTTSAQAASPQSQQGPSGAAAQSASPAQAPNQPSDDKYALPRGKKLVLKDGTYQLVRSYEKKGERVRYLSAERGTWEEIPSAMVDWDATAGAEAAEAKDEEAFAKQVHKREQAQQTIAVLDVDASLQVAPGVFLPPGEGMFLIEGRSVTPLEQAGSQVKTDKKQFLKRVLSPIPIVPNKINIEIPGNRAKIRASGSQIEFYLREPPPDPDRNSPIVKSSRPGESGPEVELVKATIKGNNRRLESISTMFGDQVDEKRATISIERWEVAPSVYRFTLSQPLPPGEYALAEILPDGMNLFVWDFGMDAGKK